MKIKLNVVHFVILFGVMLYGCSSEELMEPSPTSQQVVLSSCSLKLLDGEYQYFSNGFVSCSKGDCKDGDCITGKGKKEFPGGSLYEGTFKKGILNGDGILNICSTSKFEGTLKDGIPEKGTLTSVDGTSYSGFLKKDLYNGKGILKTAFGDEYDGTWKNGKKNGKFNLVLSGEKSSITYQDDEDLVQINRRKKEEADEKRRIAQEHAEERRLERERWRWGKENAIFTSYLSCIEEHQNEKLIKCEKK
jgi:hypothetical protein